MTAFWKMSKAHTRINVITCHLELNTHIVLSESIPS